MKEKLEQAIKRSMSHNERITVTVRDVSEALTILCGIPGYMVDSTATEQGLDVWGYTEDTPEHQMDWRLLLVQAEVQCWIHGERAEIPPGYNIADYYDSNGNNGPDEDGVLLIYGE